MIDKKSIFKATLKNETSDFIFSLVGSRYFDDYFDRMGKMSVEIEYKDGTIKRSYEKPMFCFEDKRVLPLLPGESIEGAIVFQDETGLGNGIVPPKPKLSELQSYKRIRIKLLSDLSGSKFINGQLLSRDYKVFYSNWIDVSNCDFSRIAND